MGQNSPFISPNVLRIQQNFALGFMFDDAIVLRQYHISISFYFLNKPLKFPTIDFVICELSQCTKHTTTF